MMDFFNRSIAITETGALRMCAYFEWEKYAQKMGFKNPYRERQERCRLKEV